MFSRKTQYAVRALLCLARNQESGVRYMGVRNIAAQTGIPAHWLGGIFLELRNAGIILSTRGKHGGYRLQQEPEKVNLTQILSVTEYKKEVYMDSGPFDGESVREMVDFLNPVINDLQNARGRILDNTTLAELLSRRLK